MRTAREADAKEKGPAVQPPTAENRGRPFDGWARLLAADLRPDPDERLPGGPGSLSEAVAFLLSPKCLGPDETRGHPGLYARSADPSGEVLDALYSAAFGPDLSDPDPAFRVFAVLDHEEGQKPSLEAVGLLVGGRKDVLLFSEPFLPLPEISCSNLADLRRLHARLLSAALRV